jgi:hypothetical protein
MFFSPRKERNRATAMDILPVLRTEHVTGVSGNTCYTDHVASSINLCSTCEGFLIN